MKKNYFCILLSIILTIFLFVRPKLPQTSEELKNLCKELEELQECMDSGKYANEIRKDLMDGQKAGIRGTPTFFIGISEGDASKIKALKLIRGAQPYSMFKETLDNLLTPQK